MKNLISVIVPVYNVEPYLEKCLDSLLAQTYQELEIIVVDDGATDCSGAICDRYAEQYPEKIRVFHKTNGGVSSARNLGLRKARGEYISFVDGDDWVAPCFLEALLLSAERIQAEISVCGIEYSHGKKRNITENCVLDIEKADRIGLFQKLLKSGQVGGFLCNKLFKKEMIESEMSEDIHYSEDFVFVAEYCEKVQTAALISGRYYYYRQNENSASYNVTYNDKIFSLLDAEEKIREIYARVLPDFIPQIEKNILKNALNLRARYQVCHANQDEQYQLIRAKIKRYFIPVLKSASCVSKINIVLTRLFPVSMFHLKNRLKGMRV